MAVYGIGSSLEQWTYLEDQMAAALAKFVGRSGRALATLVLSVEPTLLYLIGDPSDVDQFCKSQ